METAETIQEGEAQASLSHYQQREIGLELQATLVELVDLALLGKQLHWNVVGPGFRPLHLQLDELVTAWGELADMLAERAVAVGYWPDGQAGTVAETSELEPVSSGARADREVVQLLTSRLVEVVGRARGRMSRLGPLDLASQDVLIEVVRALEQQLWMVRAQRAL
jgi:starvation-inducible DNA-binding protein